MAQNTKKIKVFVTNLGKYNEGALVGEWLWLPASDDEIAAMLRRIGIGGIYEEDGIQIGFHRLKALQEILQKRGCYDERFFLVGEISRESGYRMVNELLEKGDVPEVLILGSDEIAEGALEAIKQRKYRIPKDIAVVIYRDIKTLETKYPTYTSLRMLPDIVWSTAMKLLLERITGSRKDTMKVYLPTKLEVGDSA